MANEKFTLEKPTLREVLPDDVVKYLMETYPPRKNGAGTIQKDGVDYITEEKDFFNRPEIKQCVKNHGLEPIGLLFVLRSKMATDAGWGIEVGDDDERAVLMYSICLLINRKQDYIEQLCKILIDCGIIKVVDGSDGKTYWTTLQQLYNYEYKEWSRAKNNFAQRKSYKKKKEQASGSLAESKDQEKVPEISAEFSVSDDWGYGDLADFSVFDECFNK